MTNSHQAAVERLTELRTSELCCDADDHGRRLALRNAQKRLLFEHRDALLTAYQAAEARNKELEGALADSEASLAIVRQSLVDQAAARLNPMMPLLIPEVVDQLRHDAEAAYAMAETREERVQAHGLSLLCDWQDKARATMGKEPQ